MSQESDQLKKISLLKYSYSLLKKKKSTPIVNWVWAYECWVGMRQQKQAIWMAQVSLSCGSHMSLK
jgi:hypothetical protein